MTWNDKTYSETVAKHPALDKRPESVALAVWALERNQAMTPDDWRELSAKTGVRVAGRAIGSARDLLGLSTAKSTPSKRKGQGKRKARASRGRSSVALDSLSDMLASVRTLEKERDHAVATLRKIQELLDATL